MKKFFIVAVACLLAVAFTAPVMAEVKVGGIVFTDIMWDNRSDDFMQATTGGANQDSVTSVRMHETLASRVYFKWANDDGVGMFIELGLGGTIEGGGGQLGPEGVYLRHAYGWWKKSDGFRLLVGMTTSVFSPLNSSQLMGFALVGDGTYGTPRAHAINCGYGNIYVERAPQIRGEWYFGANFLKIALADWLNDGQGKTPGLNNDVAGGQVAIEDTKIPRIDLGMKFMLGSWALYPGLTYINRTYEGNRSGDDDDFTVWAASLGLKGGIGPVTITIEGNYAQNGSAGGLFGANTSYATGPYGGNASPTLNANGKLYDATTWCGFINVAFKVAHATVNLVYGIADTNLDRGPGVGDIDYTSEQYGISVPIPIAKTFIIRPEVFYIDENDQENQGAADVDLGTQWIYGINFQIMF